MLRAGGVHGATSPVGAGGEMSLVIDYAEPSRQPGAPIHAELEENATTVGLRGNITGGSEIGGSRAGICQDGGGGGGGASAGIPPLHAHSDAKIAAFAAALTAAALFPTGAKLTQNRCYDSEIAPDVGELINQINQFQDTKLSKRITSHTQKKKKKPR